MSRRQVWLEEISGNRVRIRNMSATVSFNIQGLCQVKAGGVVEQELPLVLELGSKVVRIQLAKEEETGKAIQSLERPTDLPLQASSEHAIPTLFLRSSPLPSDENAIEWLRAVMRVLQSAATDSDFFQQAAQAVVEMVHLDVGRVLTRGSGRLEARGDVLSDRDPRVAERPSEPTCHQPRLRGETNHLVRSIPAPGGLLEPGGSFVGGGCAGPRSSKAP